MASQISFKCREAILHPNYSNDLSYSFTNNKDKIPHALKMLRIKRGAKDYNFLKAFVLLYSMRLGDLKAKSEYKRRILLGKCALSSNTSSLTLR